MPIVINYFYEMNNLYSIGSTVVMSVDVEPIRQRRNSDTILNNIFFFNPYGVLLSNEWEELEAISFIETHVFFFNKYY